MASHSRTFAYKDEVLTSIHTHTHSERCTGRAIKRNPGFSLNSARARALVRLIGWMPRGSGTYESHCRADAKSKNNGGNCASARALGISLFGVEGSAFSHSFFGFYENFPDTREIRDYAPWWIDCASHGAATFWVLLYRRGMRYMADFRKLASAMPAMSLISGEFLVAQAEFMSETVMIPECKWGFIILNVLLVLVGFLVWVCMCMCVCD